MYGYARFDVLGALASAMTACAFTVNDPAVRHWVQRICKAAKVPVVTAAHGMLGLHGTLAVERRRPGTSWRRPSVTSRRPLLVRATSRGRRSPAPISSPPDLKRLIRISFQTDLRRKNLSNFVEMNGIEPSAS
jgi:hypothetical protein